MGRIVGRDQRRYLADLWTFYRPNPPLLDPLTSLQPLPPAWRSEEEVGVWILKWGQEQPGLRGGLNEEPGVLVRVRGGLKRAGLLLTARQLQQAFLLLQPVTRHLLKSDRTIESRTPEPQPPLPAAWAQRVEGFLMRKRWSRECAWFKHVASGRLELSLNPTRHRGSAWESLADVQRRREGVYVPAVQSYAVVLTEVLSDCGENMRVCYIKEIQAVPTFCCVVLGPTTLLCSSTNFKTPDREENTL
ncbi:hypothetical protein ILYODFUR_010682 [Ilyodon furcidens]|uniref:Uncharacterized protein n=1 Tax=Ilyodon furcidens TaxID=33524 RepID=A0ABV0T6X4_9TELE